MPLALPARPSERDPPQTVCARNCAIHLLLHAPMHNAEKHKAGDASRKIDRSMKIRLHSSSPRELEITFLVVISYARVCVHVRHERHDNVSMGKVGGRAAVSAVTIPFRLWSTRLLNSDPDREPRSFRSAVTGGWPNISVSVPVTCLNGRHETDPTRVSTTLPHSSAANAIAFKCITLGGPMPIVF